MDDFQVFVVHHDLLNRVNHTLCCLWRLQHAPKRGPTPTCCGNVISVVQISVHILEDSRGMDLVWRHSTHKNQLNEACNHVQDPLIIASRTCYVQAELLQCHHALCLVSLTFGPTRILQMLPERTYEHPVGEPGIRRRYILLRLSKTKERFLGLLHLMQHAVPQQALLHIRLFLQHRRDELEAAQRPNVIGRLKQPDDEHRQRELRHELHQARRRRIEQDLVNKRQDTQLGISRQRRKFQMQQGIQEHGCDSIHCGATPLLEQLLTDRYQVLPVRPHCVLIPQHDTHLFKRLHFALRLGSIKHAEIGA
mmetsp:Transcript_13214/g.38318  ORF Transcript_13214/g.38318 Transcript_13214/m.38318 type:complete len:308 (+) Transcript_13214:358-1281(+)